MNSKHKNKFSLIELLVVISIIAILVAMLMPALQLAREKAKLIQCLGTSKQIGIAAHTHASDHDGRLPIAGSIDQFAGLDKQQSYDRLQELGLETYNDTGNYKNWAPVYGGGTALASAPEARIAPFPAILNNSYLGVPMDMSSFTSLWNDMKDEKKAIHFRCPSDDYKNRPQDPAAPASEGYLRQYSKTLHVKAHSKGGNPGVYWGTAPKMIAMSYGFNEALLGYSSSSPRLLGDISQVPDTSNTFMYGELLPRYDGASSYGSTYRNPWPAVFNHSADIDGNLAESANGFGWDKRTTVFDPDRHRGRMNVIFADGHGETVGMNQAELEEVNVSGGFGQ